jgi:Tfp pilus assembly protein PilV
MRGTGTSNRGTSLVEALVALAVMAFGMLAVVGIQATLRGNADVAKQRSEAVRIAQEAMESARGFSAIDITAGQTAYASIVGVVDQAVASDTANTSFMLTRTVATRTAPDRKELKVRVEWTDRSGLDQHVELNSIIGANDPRVSLALGAQPTGIPLRQPRGRHPAIPPQAVTVGESSAFRPAPDDAGHDTVVWLFDNLSGVITSVCDFPAGADMSALVPANDCVEKSSYLVSGYVRFSFGNAPDASAPIDLQISFGMSANAVGIYADGVCFVEPVREDAPLTFTRYYCRVPASADGKWSGTTLLVIPHDPNIAYDVCRYSNGAAGNTNHPQVYTLLDRSLANQNFLVIKQGVACPAGTAAHQPP